MVSIPTLAKTVRRELDARATPELRAKYERLVPGARVLGVTVPDLRDVAKQLKVDHTDATIDDACGLLTRFCRDRVREEMLIGIFFLGRFGKAVRTVDWASVESWLPALDNWETCDQLAAGVAAPVVADDLTLVSRLVALAKSDHPWTRRFALATSADLSHAGRGLTEPAFRVSTVVLRDELPMIQTAVAWALREASKADAEAVVAFLKKNKTRMRPRTVREATEKLTAEQNAELK